MLAQRERKQWPRLAAALAAVALVPACARSGRAVFDREIQELETRPWGAPSEVIAEINGTKLTRGDFYQRVLKKFGARMIFTGVLKEELFAQEAARLGIVVPEDELAVEVDKRIRAEAAAAGGVDELEKLYAREGWTLDDVRQDYANLIRQQLEAARVVQSKRRVDEAALREYYQQSYARTRYRVSMIAYKYRTPDTPLELVEQLKQDAVSKALQALGQLGNGYDFETIARNESEDVSARTGGDIGYITPEDPLPPIVKKAILSLSPGDVSDPVDFADDDRQLASIQIYRVSEVLPRRGFAECRSTLDSELRNRFPSPEEVETVLEGLVKNSSIQVFGRPADAFYAPDEQPAAAQEAAFVPQPAVDPGAPE